ncbi:MAG: hypothetical protein LLF98_01780 [Clostridium sp.]|uniref:zinc-ribbon domain-containing protein n=1 Tax=Clostridium sp. TaxID=1506 RepID=UPI0025C36C41|nr:zinc-ribbon domain-containing protein [Clostridium sp.]MCE5220010.1 hypothetical protein [Clostridium sp.]
MKIYLMNGWCINIHTYEYVKNFIEVESNSGCELLSKEYISSIKPLDIKCKCGNIFSTVFNEFKSHNKRRCHECNGMTKWNYNSVKEKLNNLGYILLDKEYINAVSKITLKDYEGYYYLTEFRIVLQSKQIQKFHPSNPYTIQNIKLWCKINNKPFELLSEEYKGVYEKLQWKCLKDGCEEIFESAWTDIKRGNGCGYCKGRQVGLSNCLAIQNSELAKEWHPTKNGDLTPYDIHYGCKQKVWWICGECDYEWPATISNRNKINGSGCPICSKSKGEKRIKKWLKENKYINITQEEYEKLNNFDKTKNKYYIFQKEFNGLLGLGNGLLSYDFYLPQYNLLIEYQGEFHDNRGGKGKGYTKQNLKQQQEHDRRKKEYANNHNIKLLEIWYWDFDNIEEILKEKIIIG